MLKLRNNLLLIIGLFSGFVQASELLTKEQLNQQLILVAQGPVENVAEAQRLLAAGADINTIVNGAGADINSILNENTALSLAVFKGHIDLARTLHDREGLDRTIWGNNLNILLVIAVFKNRIDQVTHALDAGADINSIFNDKTALYLAVEKGYIDLARMLHVREDLDRTIWQNDLNIFLTQAVRKNEIDTARHALAAGADVNQADAYGYTPLMLASQNRYAAVVQMLLEAGANVNHAYSVDPFKGYTPLMIASLYGYTEIVRILLEAGANVNHADADGRTALNCAIESGVDVDEDLTIEDEDLNIEIVNLLLGADINLDDCQKELVRLKSSPYYSDDSDNYYKKIVDILGERIRCHKDGLRMAWIGAVHLASNNDLDDHSGSRAKEPRNK